ncbi:hypothetical protein ACOXXX_14785 [Thalassococcus sp. BH17M4-6]|uniref:hypothetical protein n=1 Tax=Thalassococcus sp. BH17M4-6 TaxID=3413148 RepID=UPI003BE74A93
MSSWAKPQDPAHGTCGFVFAASGQAYATLAEQACDTLRNTNPGFEVDLFTDCDVRPGLFSRVHPLDRSWFRPKFEALLKSRFDRTIYLDCDLVVVADLSDVFWLLQKHDIAAAHAPVRNAGFATSCWRTEIPNSFPMINAGVMGVRNSPESRAFLSDCQTALIESGLPRDQIIVRELLWQSGLRLAVLPPEYNVRDERTTLMKGSRVGAPRVLHSSAFTKRMQSPDRAPTPHEIYGEVFLDHVDALIRADRQLSPGGQRQVQDLPLGRMVKWRAAMPD